VSGRLATAVEVKAAYIPAHLRDALTECARVSSRDRAQIVLQAIEDHRDQLRAEFVTNAPAGGTRQAPTVRRRRDGEQRRQLTLHLGPQAAERLDKLVTDLGAGSRSALIEAALGMHLGIPSENESHA